MKPGKFDGDLHVTFEFNAAEQWYRVVVREWVQRRLGPGYWGSPSPILHDFPTRDFPAKRRERALRYYLKVHAERQRRRVERRSASNVAAGWERLA